MVGDIEKLRQLVGNGTDINSNPPYFQTSIHPLLSFSMFTFLRSLHSPAPPPPDLPPPPRTPTAPDAIGMRPLHYAAQLANSSALSALLSLGADVNASTSKHGNTAMHWAASQGRAESLRLLQAAGANVNARSIEMECPLHSAAARGRTAAVRALVELGAEVGAHALAGDTPGGEGRAGFHTRCLGS